MLANMTCGEAGVRVNGASPAGAGSSARRDSLLTGSPTTPNNVAWPGVSASQETLPWCQTDPLQAQQAQTHALGTDDLPEHQTKTSSWVYNRNGETREGECYPTNTEVSKATTTQDDMATIYLKEREETKRNQIAKNIPTITSHMHEKRDQKRTKNCEKAKAEKPDIPRRLI